MLGAILALSLMAAAVAPAAASAHSKRHHARHLSARYLHMARTALVQFLHTHRSTVQLAVPPTSATASSYNWSGYADTSSTTGYFKKVTAKWAQPAVSCTSEDQLSSQWVGIDGYGSGTVEQDGTMGWCFEGTATYYSWYEMYPAGLVTLGDTVAPGDAITSTVSHSGTSYTLKVADATHTANSFSRTATCAAATCTDESVEWINERPSFSIGIAPLAKYTLWKVTSAAATGGSTNGTIKSFGPTQLDMIDATDSYDLSDASALNSTGNGFSTTWLNSW
jgi:hypothetical protein